MLLGITLFKGLRSLMKAQQLSQPCPGSTWPKETQMPRVVVRELVQGEPVIL